MGRGKKLVCGKCGYSLRYMEGIGMLHPHNCKSMLEEMKEGKEGEKFKKYANELSNPAINMELALFKCEKCGDLVGDKILEICEKVGEYYPNNGNGWLGVDKLENFPMALSSVHRAVYSKPHFCKCGGEMKPVDSDDIIKCPRCQAVLENENEIMFD